MNIMACQALLVLHRQVSICLSYRFFMTIKTEVRHPVHQVKSFYLLLGMGAPVIHDSCHTHLLQAYASPHVPSGPCDTRYIPRSVAYFPQIGSLNSPVIGISTEQIQEFYYIKLDHMGSVYITLKFSGDPNICPVECKLTIQVHSPVHLHPTLTWSLLNTE